MTKDEIIYREDRLVEKIKAKVLKYLEGEYIIILSLTWGNLGKSMCWLW